jgi:PKD domain
MFIVSILGLTVTAFRYKNDTPCAPFQFSLYANYFNTGHFIFFKASDTRNAKTWEWDFGDKTPVDKTSGPVTKHVYQQAGEYIISLKLDGNCKEYGKVVINNVQKDSIRYVMPQVVWPAEPVMADQDVLFNDITNGANSWEWYIGEGKESKRFVTKDVAYTFSKPGLVTVKLFVNGNKGAMAERVIKIEDNTLKNRQPVNRNRAARRPANRYSGISDKPSTEAYLDDVKPAEPVESKTMAPELTREYFLQMIRGVIKGVVFEKDFDPYMCNNKNIRVSFNGDDIGFTECISRLQKIKRLKSLKASAYTDSGTNCIINISIAYEKKKVLGIF